MTYRTTYRWIDAWDGTHAGWCDPRHAMVYFNPSPGDIAGRL